MSDATLLLHQIQAVGVLLDSTTRKSRNFGDVNDRQLAADISRDWIDNAVRQASSPREPDQNSLNIMALSLHPHSIHLAPRLVHLKMLLCLKVTGIDAIQLNPTYESISCARTILVGDRVNQK